MYIYTLMNSRYTYSKDRNQQRICFLFTEFLRQSRALFLKTGNQISCLWNIRTDWKTTAIRRIAAWETDVSRHHGTPSKIHPGTPPYHHSTIVFRGWKRPLTGPPLCRVTLERNKNRSLLLLHSGRIPPIVIFR